MRQIFIFLLCAQLCFSSPVHATSGADCSLASNDAQLSDLLNSTSEQGLSIIYVRADWAISSVLVNDVYVQSIAFSTLLGDTGCIVVDVSKTGGADVMKRFDAQGVPIFAIVDHRGNLIAKKVAGVEFPAFKTWFESVKQSWQTAAARVSSRE